MANFNTIIATFLDPRYKTNFFLRNDDAVDIQEYDCLTKLSKIKEELTQIAKKLKNIK